MAPPESMDGAESAGWTALKCRRSWRGAQKPSPGPSPVAILSK